MRGSATPAADDRREWRFGHSGALPTEAVDNDFELVTRDLRLPSRLALGGDDPLEAVGIEQPEYSRAPRRVQYIGLEDASARSDSVREIVNVLSGRQLQRESLAFHAIDALRAVVLSDQHLDRTSFERDGTKHALVLVSPGDCKANDVAVPREARVEILD